MKNLKRTAALAAVIGLIAAGTTVYAATAATPAEIVSQLTGKSVEAVTQERLDGNTYGEIAEEAGVLDAFKDQMLESKKAWLAERVEAGTLTQAQADEIIQAMEANQAVCDGTGSARIGRGLGAGFGQGAGQCLGLGQGAGAGQGQFRGMGMRGLNGFGRTTD